MELIDIDINPAVDTCRHNSKGKRSNPYVVKLES